MPGMSRIAPRHSPCRRRDARSPPRPPPPPSSSTKSTTTKSGADAAEFAEIRNNGETTVELEDFALRLVNGNDDGAATYDTIDLPAVLLEPGDLFVVCANAETVPGCDLDDGPDTDFIQNGAPDAVALVEGDTVVDTLSYEGNTAAPYTEGTGTAAADSNTIAFIGLSRAPGGVDTGDNAADFTIRCITPGTPNSLSSSGCTEPPADAVTSLRACRPSIRRAARRTSARTRTSS